MAAPVVASHATAHVINTTGDVTVTKPTGVDGSDGEWLFAYYLTFGQGSAQTHTPPSGFTLIDSQTETYFAGPGRGSTYRKKTTGSEPADYTFDSGVSADTYGVVLMWRITGCDDTTPVDDNAYTNTVAPASTYTFPSVTTTGADRLLLICGGLANNPKGTEWPDAVPTGFTRQAWVNDTAEFVNVGSATKTQASAGASGTFTVPFNDLDDMSQGFTLAIAPASADTSVEPGAGALTYTGYAPALSLPSEIAPGVGDLTYTGHAPSVGNTSSVSPGAGSLAYTGFAPTIATVSNVSPGAGSLSITGYAPTVGGSTTVAPGAGALTITGYAPSLIVPSAVSPGAGTLTYTGYAPGFSSAVTLTASPLYATSLTASPLSATSITASPL